MDEDGNQQAAYEWCSQESDEESNYGGEIDQNENSVNQAIQSSECGTY